MRKEIITEIVACDGCEKDITKLCYYTDYSLDFCDDCITTMLKNLGLNKSNYQKFLEKSLSVLDEAKTPEVYKPVHQKTYDEPKINMTPMSSLSEL